MPGLVECFHEPRYQRVEHIEPCRVVIDPLAVLRKAFAYLVEHGGEVAHWSGML